MSGHNRWSKLKRYKLVVGAAKGKLFSKVIKEITVAARLGGGDAVNNPRLRVALAQAREANIPSDTIARAIKKGTGELEGVSYEDVLYEGYGPGGVAMLIECLTDNLNRTAADVRSTLLNHEGNLGAPGSVKFLFSKQGVIAVNPGATEERVLELALEAGADDVIAHGELGFEVRTAAAALHAVAEKLEARGLKVAEQKATWLPSTLVTLDQPAQARALLELIDALEDNDDVQNVYANYELADGVAPD